MRKITKKQIRDRKAKQKNIITRKKALRRELLLKKFQKPKTGAEIKRDKKIADKLKYQEIINRKFTCTLTRR